MDVPSAQIAYPVSVVRIGSVDWAWLKTIHLLISSAQIQSSVLLYWEESSYLQHAEPSWGRSPDAHPEKYIYKSDYIMIIMYVNMLDNPG